MQKVCILTNNDHDDYQIIFNNFDHSNQKKLKLKLDNFFSTVTSLLSFSLYDNLK